MIDDLESPYIFEGNGENFNTLVLENSKAGPVLVNFWSKKAGPCLRQYPILDKLVHEYSGKFLLVNVDADSEKAVTNNYGINSIPTLKVFRQGLVMESQFGYQSESELRKLLDRYVVRESDLVLSQALEYYAKGDQDTCYDMIAKAIIADQNNIRLPVALCKLLKHEGRFIEAQEFINSLPKFAQNNQEITKLRDSLYFLIIASGINDVTKLIEELAGATDKLEDRKMLSAYYATQGDYSNALTQLSYIMGVDKNFRNLFAKTALIKIINLLGNDHDLMRDYRRALRQYSN